MFQSLGDSLAEAGFGEHACCEHGIGGCEAGADDECGWEVGLEDEVGKEGGYRPGEGHDGSEEVED